MATDIRVEAENRPGVLATIGRELGNAGINIDGFCAATSDGEGAIHLLVEDAGVAREKLEAAGYVVAAEHEAIVVDTIDDSPGALGALASKLADHGINVSTGYLATGTRVVFVVDDPERAREML